MLETIVSGVRPRPRKTVIYGVHGIGKSTFASESRDPIVVPTEEGLDDIDVPRFPVQRDYLLVMQALRHLHDEQHEYSTVVVDSVDWLERLIWAHVCSQRGVENIEDIDYGKGYNFAVRWWIQFIDALDALRVNRNMAVILVAHAEVNKFADPEHDSYHRYQPKLHKSANDLIQEWADEVLFARHQVHTVSEDQGFNKTRARGIAGDRILYTEERPSHLAKNRLGMPLEIPLSYAAYESYFPTKKTTKKETVANGKS